MGRLPWIALLILASFAGCVEEEAPPPEGPQIVWSLHRGGDCPDIGGGKQMDRQASSGTVAVTIRLWMQRVGEEPVQGVRVAAVQEGAVVKEYTDLWPDATRCALAEATTGRDGSGIVHLLPGQAFAAASGIPGDPFMAGANRKGGLYATQGMVVDLLALDSSNAPRNACGLPTRPWPDALPTEQQFAVDTVPVTFRFSGPRGGGVPDFQHVAAVATTQAVANSSADAEVRTNPCAYASGSTMDRDDVVLRLSRGQAFRVAVPPPDGVGGRATAGPYTASDGLVVLVPLYDSSGAPPGACGRPAAPKGLGADTAFAAHTVPVTVVAHNVVTGRPASGYAVHAVDPATPRPFPAVAPGRADSSCWIAAAAWSWGAPTLYLEEGDVVDLLVYPSLGGESAGAVLRNWTVRAGDVSIDVVPSSVSLVLPGRIQLPTEEVDIPLGLSPEAQARLKAIDGVRLAWTNVPTSWGDLYPFMAVGEGAPYTDAAANGQEGPLAGDVEERLDDTLSGHECEARQDGFRFVVRSPSQTVVTAGSVDFALHARIYLSHASDFVDPAPLAC